MRRYYNLILCSLVLGGCLCSADTLNYNVTVNTSSLAGSPEGYLDFQFNAPSSSTGTASASVSNFVTDGTLDLSSSTLVVQGNVTGNLPAGITIVDDPSNAVNEYSPGFTYGNNLQFQLTLSLGTPPDAGGTFLFYLYDSTFASPLTTDPSSPDGRALQITINPGTCSGTGCLTINDYSSFLNISLAPATTPEPATWLLLLAGIAALAAGRCYQTRRR
jgi:hypothetical protein